MQSVTGKEFVGVSAGGSTAGGQYIWLTLKLGDTDETIVVEKSRVTALIAAVGTAAGMARTERIKVNPAEEQPGGKDSAFALELAHSAVGTTPDGIAILDLRVNTQPRQQMNLFLAADRAALLQLGHTCQRGLTLLASPEKSGRR